MNVNNTLANSEMSSMSASKDDNFEQVPASLRRQEKNQECLMVRGLVKDFGAKKAVRGLSMDIYKG